MLYGYGCKSAAIFNMLTDAAHTYKCHILHVVVGTCIGTLSTLGGANFNYQNMDVARTLYTSAVKKLFDQGGGSILPVAPIVPTPMSGIYLIACQPYCYCTAGVSLLYIDTNCCQHVMAAMLAIYLEPLTFSCTLQFQLICSVVIGLCILTVIDCYVFNA